MQFLRNHWYYWYTGQPLIALTSVLLTFAVLWGGMVWLGGYSIWGILIAVALDSVGFWLALIYAIALRFYLPTMMVAQIDELIINHLVIPLCATFVANRSITWLVARLLSGAKSWVKLSLWGVIALVVGMAGWQGYSYYHAKQAELEAERQRLEALKAQAAAVVDSTVAAANQATTAATKAANDVAVKATETANQLADDAKNAALEACQKTATYLGKNPDDYCK